MDLESRSRSQECPPTDEGIRACEGREKGQAPQNHPTGYVAQEAYDPIPTQLTMVAFQIPEGRPQRRHPQWQWDGSESYQETNFPDHCKVNNQKGEGPGRPVVGRRRLVTKNQDEPHIYYATRSSLPSIAQ